MLFWLLSLAWLALPGAYARAEPSDQEKLKAVYKMYADYKADFPGVPDVSPKQAMELLKQGQVVFVDARPADERQVAMLPQAISQEEFLRDPAKYREKTVIAYCTISYRSGVLASKLRKKGVEIYNLRGGLLAWVHEGGKVYDQKGPTKRIHVYGRRWNLPPKGYEAVW
jgi:sodium/bile acid cotransporter 7